MQATLWWWRMSGPKVLRTILGKFIHQIPNWNQDTYRETWKDLKIILTKCVFII